MKQIKKGLKSGESGRRYQSGLNKREGNYEVKGKEKGITRVGNSTDWWLAKHSSLTCISPSGSLPVLSLRERTRTVSLSNDVKAVLLLPLDPTHLRSKRERKRER